MKTTLIVIVLLMTLILVLFFVRGFMSRSGSAAGLVTGQLTACPDKPNCVCSERSSNNDSYIPPMLVGLNDIMRAKAVLTGAIVDLGGQIQIDNDDYLAATFSSAFFGFVDDLEVRFDAARRLIHIRSASRVGQSDFGVNRKRVDLLKKRYAEKVSDINSSSNGVSYIRS